MNAKERIIATAGKLFFERGYVNVLMAEIAREAGMSKKTLYQHFAGKEELVQEVIRAYQHELQNTVEQLINNPAIPFPEKASLIFKHVANRLQDINPQFIEDIKQISPQSWKLVHDYKTDAAYLRFSRLLEEGAQLGYLREDINRSLAVVLYASALDAVVNPAFMRQVPEQLSKELPYNPDAILDGLVKIIFKGVLNCDNH